VGFVVPDIKCSVHLASHLQLVLLLCGELSPVLQHILLGPVKLLHDGFNWQHVPGLVQQLLLRRLGLERPEVCVVCVAVGAGIC